MSNETKQEHHSPKDWVEDFDQENGNYSCTCVFCKEEFTGYKRRVVCKECDAKEHTVEGCVTAVLDLRKQEHTERELWKVVLTPNGYSVFNSIGKKIASQVSKVEAERIIACVNAMEGIEDPEEFMSTVKEAFKEEKLSGAEVLNQFQNHFRYMDKFKTACESINPENPMAVAENLNDLLYMVKRLLADIEAIPIGALGASSYESLSKLLTKIQSK